MTCDGDGDARKEAGEAADFASRADDGVKLLAPPLLVVGGPFAVIAGPHDDPELLLPRSNDETPRPALPMSDGRVAEELLAAAPPLTGVLGTGKGLLVASAPSAAEAPLVLLLPILLICHTGRDAVLSVDAEEALPHAAGAF